MSDKCQFQEEYCLNSLNIKRGGNSVDRIGAALFNSKIKLTPHQIQAALFAFNSPLSRGVLLADEVGLGKTIEAGIIISQLWSEGKRNILIVSPASLMRQWGSELFDKFHLSSFIMDRKMFNSIRKSGHLNPFEESGIIICSYQMCSTFADEVQKADFDYVIIDEAHKLRNVHNDSSVVANRVSNAVQRYKKALLTATPLQNNLLDLYGLASVIDENIFGEKEVFKYNYIKYYDENKTELESRLKRFTHRTLRNQVEQYVRFTKRIPQTFTFQQTDGEKRLYNEILALLQDEEHTKYIIPPAQRHLLLLVLCKLMGSSVVSVAGTMETILQRLIQIKSSNEDEIVIENWDFDDFEEDDFEEVEALEIKETVDVDELELEISRVEKIIELTKCISVESKYLALKESLEYAFKHLQELGANEKVIIFTESKRTQEFLKDALIRDGYSGVMTYNGSNTDDESKKILSEWVERPENVDKQKNSRAVNMRAAILDKFESDGEILISTEAGAEGLNLQFCSLVINYDLPWNPQRVEQRIGRCHRFGQKYDVVVINFINANNLVENRVYELLNNKFHLFEEVFGSSDEVLGRINDGKDIEKEIVNIYLSCRTDDEINHAFDELQEEYKEDIELALEHTKEDLLNNFDEDVQKLFDDVLNSALNSMSELEQLFWRLSKCVLGNDAQFNDENMTFTYGTPKRIYCLSNHNSEHTGFVDYGQFTELGQYVLNKAIEANAKFGKVQFDISNYPFKLKRIESLKGRKGYLKLCKLEINSFDNEEYIVFNGIWDDFARIDDDIINKLMRLEMKESYYDELENPYVVELKKDVGIHVEQLLKDSQDRNNTLLQEEIMRINKWADDKIQATQLDVELLREQRRALQRESDQATNLVDKERIEESIQKLTKKIKKSWVLLANAEEDVEAERFRLINKIRNENMKKWSVNDIFTVEFEIV